MNMQETQARIEMTKASATAAEGLGIERLSRVAENQAMVDERKANADQSRDTGILNLVKAIKEFDTIDIDQAHKIVQLMNVVKAQSASDVAENNAQTQQFMQQTQAQNPQNMNNEI